MFGIFERIEAIDQWNAHLGQMLSDYTPDDDSLLDRTLRKAEAKNRWFTRDSSIHALRAWNGLLQRENLNEWVNAYPEASENEQTVGIIMAGNVPLVGMHDLLAVLLSGYRALVKMSTDDSVLVQFVIDGWKATDERFGEVIRTTEDRLNGADRIIATGSNNTARYFEYYFKDTPHIIRKNRKSIAVLNGSETEEELRGLAADIFTHFGLGCRNVSQLYIPADYDLDHFFKGIFDWADVINHQKYANNYDYHKAIFLMNLDDVIENGFLILKESNAWSSPVGTLFYARYNDTDEVAREVEARSEELQVAVSSGGWFPGSLPMGTAQNPGLTDYADGVDTMAWLREG